MSRLYTVGYEGAELSDFLATLSVCGIRQVIDVRDVANSRRRGFAKRALSAALAERRIEYVHLKDLGDPKPGRIAARSGDYARFRVIYNDHLRSVRAQAALASAVALASDMTSCLLCYERAHQECHRTIVANSMSKDSKFDVRHIGVRDGIGSVRKGRRGQSINQLALG